jgi:diguanylate cyclase (GGDEF)-like protein
MTTSRASRSEQGRNRPIWQVRSGAKSAPKAFPRPLPPDAHGREAPARESLAALPAAAQLFVVAVSGVGSLVVIQSMPYIGGGHPAMFAVFMGVSLLASMAKIAIPVPGSASTLTACHVIDVATLILCGTDSAVLVAAWGGWTQSIFRSARRNPAHRIVFSIAALALTMRAAGAAYLWLGGQAGVWSAPPQLEPIVAAGTVVFLINSGLVAAAIALSTRGSVFQVWFDSFFSSWPSYVIGMGLAAAISIGIERGSYWLLPLLAAPLALVHRNFVDCLGRMSDAITDPLTGLPNQRYLVEHATRELARARRNGSRLAVVVMDLDGFKSINDIEGHAAGDAVLRAVAGRLRHSIRSHDVCARYGGDEFLLVLADCGSEEAQWRTEELRSAVSAIDVSFWSVEKTPLTISAGTAVFPDDGDSLERLFVAADGRMYECKYGRPAAAVQNSNRC